MKSTLNIYKSKYNEIKTKPEFATGLAQEFVSELLSLEPEKRFSLIPLFREIEEYLFSQGTEIPNLDLTVLETEKENWIKSKKHKTERKAIDIVNADDDFNKVLFYLFSKYNSVFSKIKGYFLFRLVNVDSAKTKVCLLYDDEFNKHPEINTFDYNETEYDLKKYHLSDFIKLVNKEENYKNQNYLCVILITQHLRDNQNIVDEIKELTNLFSNSDFVMIKNRPVTRVRDFEYKQSYEGIKRIEGYSNKIFNNKELSFEDELIIKQLFPGKEMILDYKILKGGNSGSKVIEVQPLKSDFPRMSRFVVKFCEIDVERKIRTESERFQEFMTLVSVPNYSSNYCDNETHEAIRYNYASSDSKNDSFSFSSLINEFIKGKYNHSFELKNVIDELFVCDPFKIWDTGKYDTNENVSSLYLDYLKSEEKILNSISQITGKLRNDINELDLIKNYNLIKGYQLQTKKKICHGDLHSENFFKDEEGVYLIDFGWTNKHHALIDFATLECSLKYKHLPFYIKHEDLINYEIKLLNTESFSTSFDLTFIEIPIARRIFELIIQIREKAKLYMKDPSDCLEYLVSLFIMSFRQIQYSDLNQRYAFNTAEVLSNEIIKKIYP